MLTAAEITSMRSVQALALPDSCIISRDTIASDGRGGVTRTPATVATVDCRLAVGGGQATEEIDAERLRNESSWIITVAQGTDVRDGDRIVIGSRSFEVLKARAHGAWEMARQVTCIEIV